MKRAYSATMLLIFLFNGIGFYCYYGIELWRIKSAKRAAIRSMPREKLTHFLMTKKEFDEALVEEDEMQYEGRMYDIGYYLVDKNNVVSIFCLEDPEEMELVGFVAEIIGKPIDNKAIPSVVINFLCLIFVAPAGQSLSAPSEMLVCHDCCRDKKPLMPFNTPEALPPKL